MFLARNQQLAPAMSPKTRSRITESCVRVLFRSALVCVAALGLVLVVLPPAGNAAPAYGRISGVVHLVAPGGTRLRSGDYPSRRVNRRAPAPAEMSNVVVFIKDAPAAPDLPVTRTSISQHDESFVPRVTAISRGSSVEFPNLDPYFHNVFSLSRGATFDLGRFRQGEKRERTFDHAGLVKVYCHIHSEMAATIMVFDHPFYTMPAADGAFAIDEVPPGTYRLSAWHERVGETTQTVAIAAGDDIRVEFSLPVVGK